MSASPYPRPASRPCSCYRSATVSRSRGDCSRPKPPSRSLPRAAWPPDVVHRAAAVVLALGTDTINSVAPYPGDIVVPPLATRPLAQSWTAEVPARLDWPPTGATTSRSRSGCTQSAQTWACATRWNRTPIAGMQLLGSHAIPDQVEGASGAGMAISPSPSTPTITLPADPAASALVARLVTYATRPHMAMQSTRIRTTTGTPCHR
jgi:hypothetical protein